MHPELLTLYFFGKSITFYSYGLLIFLAIIFGLLVFFWQIKKKNLDFKQFWDVVLLTLLIGFVGSRIFYVLWHFDWYKDWPNIFKIWQGGMSFYGAFIFGFLAFIFWIFKKDKKNFWRWLDVALPALILANAIGKIGCFLNGCCYGRPSHFFWATKIPVLEDNILRHPVQLYESLAYFIIFVILISLSAKKFSGFVFFSGLILHSLVRFLLEFFRDQEFLFTLGKINLSDGQLISLIILILGFLGLTWFIIKKRI